MTQEQPEALELAALLDDVESRFLSHQAAAELRRLHAENEALRTNDARYRWLRHGDNDEQVLCRGPVAHDYWYLPRNERLDAAIDAAMKGQS